MDQRSILEAALEGRDLSRALARETLGHVLDGVVDGHWLAGWLIALRAKGETVDELAGMAEAMRDHVARVDTGITGLVDTCGTGGDGADTFNVSTASAFVAAGAGATVAKHGNRAVSSQCGSADVLEELGGVIDLDAADVAECLRTLGFGFQFAPRHHAAMRHAGPARRGLGVRTAFNLLGPLTNPAGAEHQVIGVFAVDRLDIVAQTLAALGTGRSLVVHGRDGLDELSVCAVSDARLVDGDTVTALEVDPAELGLGPHPAESLRGGDAAQNASIIRNVLDGAPGAARDIVVLNAAAALLVADLAEDLADGVKQARHAIDDGRAADVLERWCRFTAERSAS